MLRTFGQQLHHFANAADIVKDDEFSTVLDAVREYIGQYDIDKVELVVESVISGQPALTQVDVIRAAVWQCDATDLDPVVAAIPHDAAQDVMSVGRFEDLGDQLCP